MRESRGSTKPKGAMKVKACLSAGLGRILRKGAQDRPVSEALSSRRSKSVHVGTRKMVNYA